MLHFRTFRRVILYVILATAVAPLAGGAAQAGPQVERISMSERSDGNGYVIRFHMDGPVAAYSEPEKRGSELKIILFNAALSPAYSRMESAGPVRSMSEEHASAHIVFRFLLDGMQPIDASAYRDRETNDILLGLTYGSGGAIADDTRDLPVPVRRVATEQGGSSTSGSDERPPTGGTRAATPSVEGTRWLLDTVVIDAGHGGRDPGAQANGVREKDVTLAVGLKLGEYLRERLGVNVVFTREDDRFITLKDRGRIANDHGSKLFISIHANAARSSTAHGTETYFLGAHKSAAARNTMERENAVVKYENAQHVYEDLTEEALIRMELTQSAYMRKSQELSALIQQQFETRARRHNRGVKQAGFYVLWGASMPAVLVELGFVTNRREAAFLRSEQGQDYMASAIYRAVREYKERYEKGLSGSVAD